MTSRSPVPFVVGVGRSGTTLLRLMLDAHPDLAIPPETQFIPDAIRAARGSPAPAESFCDAVVTSLRWPDFGVAGDELRRRVGGLRPFDVGEALRAFYRLYAERFGKHRFGDKSPIYVRHMATIQGALPEVHFIHVVRDGRDVACSVVPLSWGPGSVAEAAAWWRDAIVEARARAKELGVYTEVRYEDLIVRPEEVLGQICRGISLPFSPRMLDYHRHAGERIAELDRDLLGEGGRVVLSAGERMAMHELTRFPPRSDRAGRWQREMTPAARREFDAVAGSLLEQLGYRL